MKEVQVTLPAKADVRGIWNYFAQYSESRAIQVLDSLERIFEALLLFPGMGRRRDELAPGCRTFVKDNFLICYEPIDDGLRILRVLHGAQDIKAAFDDSGDTP